MREKKTDRRVRYTKMVIRQALLDLMEEKPIGKISVTELCERADINRGTFYSHYASPADLLDHIENELLVKVSDALEHPAEGADILDMLTDILAYLADNLAFSRILIGPNGDEGFVHRIVNIAHDDRISVWRGLSDRSGDPEKLEWVYAFISQGSAGIVRSWIAEGAHRAPREMAEIMVDLIDRCLDGR